MNKKKAFTLIELLIVVVIIGILAVAVFIAVSGARAKAQNANAKNSISELSKALEVYMADKDVADFSALTTSTGAVSVETILPNLLDSSTPSKRLINSVPLDAQSQPVEVRFSGSSYTIKAGAYKTGTCWFSSTIDATANHNNLSSPNPAGYCTF